MHEKIYNKLKENSLKEFQKNTKPVLIDHIFALYKIIQYGYSVRRGMKFYFILSLLINIGLVVYLIWS